MEYTWGQLQQCKINYLNCPAFVLVHIAVVLHVTRTKPGCLAIVLEESTVTCISVFFMGTENVMVKVSVKMLKNPVNEI